MLTPDFTERSYVTEVVKTSGDAGSAANAVLDLCYGPHSKVDSELSGFKTTYAHGRFASAREFSRVRRFISEGEKRTIELPRRVRIGGKTNFLYDVILAWEGSHLVIAAPFHSMAEELFPSIDQKLAGTKILYERLDITRMVIKLGPTGSTIIRSTMSDGNVSLAVTRCHLAYVSKSKSNATIKQLQMTGANLGSSPEYQRLIKAVLNPLSSEDIVTPIVLGFSMQEDGVRKSSATTDRHGNFKLWIAPGLRQLMRLFTLLRGIEELGNVTATTTNVPILQSKSIREAEE